MSTYPPPGSSAPGPRGKEGIEEILARIEQELRQAVAYVNDNVVPQVRRESVSAMRSLAGTLHSLADRLEKTSPEKASPYKDDPKGPQAG